MKKMRQFLFFKQFYHKQKEITRKKEKNEFLKNNLKSEEKYNFSVFGSLTKYTYYVIIIS